MRGEYEMKNEKFDLFEGIELTSEEKKYFDEQEEVTNIIIKMIKRRIELNMTQRDLAIKTGIKQPMIARIESFESTPRLDTLIKIANALTLKLDFVNTGKIDVNVNLNVNINYKIDNKPTNFINFFNNEQHNLPTIS